MIQDESLSREESLRPAFFVTVKSHRFIRTLFFCLLGLELLLVFLDATVNYGEWASSGAIQRLFNITREDALGNWFQSTQTFLVGLVLWLIFWKTKNDSVWRGRGWLLLAVFFTYLAIDDGAKIHERIGTAVDQVSDDSEGLSVPSVPSEKVFRFPSYTWQLIFGPFLGGMGLFTLMFLWREFDERKLRMLLILGLSCFVAAVGLDFVEGLEGGYVWVAEAFPWFDIDYDALEHFAKALEEFIEMLGTTLLLLCFLSFFVRIAPISTVRFL
jgi:hypothetical protein